MQGKDEGNLHDSTCTAWQLCLATLQVVLMAAHLKQGDMVHDGPVREAVIAEIAQVVAVAPHLLLQLRVADRRAGHVLIHGMRVLRQLAREVAQVLVHLHPTKHPVISSPIVITTGITLSLEVSIRDRHSSLVSIKWCAIYRVLTIASRCMLCATSRRPLLMMVKLLQRQNYLPFSLQSA